MGLPGRAVMVGALAAAVSGCGSTPPTPAATPAGPTASSVPAPAMAGAGSLVPEPTVQPSPVSSPSPSSSAPPAPLVQLDMSQRFSVGVRADGTVSAWGPAPATPAGLTGVVSVAAGWDHVVALRSDGTVVEWAAEGAAPMSPPAGLSGVKAVGHLASMTVEKSGTDLRGKPEDAFAAIKADGSLVVWGKRWCGNTTVPKGLTRVVAITADPEMGDGSGSRDCGVVLALRSDGSIVGWGKKSDWSHTTGFGPAPTVARWTAQFRHAVGITAGGGGFAVAESTGRITWQMSDYGGTATVKDVKQISLGGCFGLALRRDGTVKGFGVPDMCTGDAAAMAMIKAGATPPAGLKGVVQVIAQGMSGVALTSEGALVVWGSDASDLPLPPAPQ